MEANSISTIPAPLYQKLKRMKQDVISFEHIEGLIEVPTPPVFSGVFSPPFFNFWHGNSPQTVINAVQRIKNTMADKGPFDGVFGVSEGGAALLSALMQEELQSFGLKFIVLVAPTPPFESSGRRRLDVSQTGRAMIEIPTIFITGAYDPLRPLPD
ncbi:MAG: hypothetical protein Q9163_002689 [Psora crenata]